VDYLLKPIRAERLAQAVDRVQRRRLALASPAPAAATAPDPAGAAPAAGPTPPDETIPVELGGVTRWVRRSDVVFVEAQRDYVRLSTRTGGHLVRVPLATLEERWAPAGFLRVHRRFLVNSAYVEGLRTSAGRVSVDLGLDQAVPVSRRFTASVRAALVQRPSLDPAPRSAPARPAPPRPSSPGDGPTPGAAGPTPPAGAR